jgi:hypothetical protein
MAKVRKNGDSENICGTAHRSSGYQEIRDFASNVLKRAACTFLRHVDFEMNIKNADLTVRECLCNI